jgi:hypothetical protein
MAKPGDKEREGLMARTLLDALKDRGARNRFQRERARGRVEGFWIAAVMTIIALVAASYLFPSGFAWLIGGAG